MHVCAHVGSVLRLITVGLFSIVFVTGSVHVKYTHFKVLYWHMLKGAVGSKAMKRYTLISSPIGKAELQRRSVLPGCLLSLLPFPFFCLLLLLDLSTFQMAGSHAALLPV